MYPRSVFPLNPQVLGDQINIPNFVSFSDTTHKKSHVPVFQKPSSPSLHKSITKFPSGGREPPVVLFRKILGFPFLTKTSIPFRTKNTRIRVLSRNTSGVSGLESRVQTCAKRPYRITKLKSQSKMSLFQIIDRIHIQSTFIGIHIFHDFTNITAFSN